MRRTVFPNRWLPYALVLPQVIVTAVFFFWPAGKSLYLSLFKSPPFGGRDVFVGLENFVTLLTTPEYYDSVINSFIFAIGVTALSVAGGMVVATLANAKIRGLAIYRTALLWPYAIAPAVAGIIFLFMFHPSYGVLPYALSFVITADLNWLLDGRIAMALVILATAWTRLGYTIAFFLAGLQAIPTSLMEAASVDGASSLRKFWSIVVPLLSPVTFYLVVVNMVFSFFEAFGVIHAVTQGGPGNATEIMVFKLWKDGFVGLNLGSSAAQSVILMALVIVLTAMQFRFAEKKVTY
jgi:sn-glycerol 3-phosphate transport system permease protein